MAVEVQVPVIRGGCVRGASGRSIPRVVGEIAAGDLCSRFDVPRFQHGNGEGYQRAPSTQRIRQLVNELRAGQVDLPTAVLLNLRGFDPRRHVVTAKTGHDQLVLGDERLYVVDGQHRLVALSQLINDDEGEWPAFRIPFVCLLGATAAEEMRQFYIVNSRAKSVPTDLAYTLLHKRAQESPEERDALLEGKDGWKVTGQELAERLARETPWEGRIRFPSEKKTKRMTIPSSGMVNSLRELIRGAYPYFESAGIDQQVEMLSAYWSGILRVLPEANEAPDAYTIQKMTGAVVMHMILPNVVELLRSKGHSALDPDAHAAALDTPLRELQDSNRNGELVSGAAFWRSGADGAAGAFSSNAGRRVLRARLLSRLEQITIN